MAVVDRVYARSLFEAAQEQGKLAPVHEQLSDFVEAVREVPELRSLLVNPEVDSRLKADALADLLGGAEEIVRNFIRLLAENCKRRRFRSPALELHGIRRAVLASP